MELTVNKLSKQYKEKTAISNVSFSLQPGVTGLLGANGAGKTTLMRMICGLLTPTEGSISFRELPVSSDAYRALLGYLPQDFGYYPDFTPRDFLTYMGALKGLSKETSRRKAEELLDLVDLTEVADKRIKTFSGGMKQRVGIAQALLNDPKLLILDEPTTGLDPKERVRFRNLIEELGRDSVVLFSTHIVSDVEHIADRVLMLQKGQIIFDGSWDSGRGDLEEFYLDEFQGEE